MSSHACLGALVAAAIAVAGLAQGGTAVCAAASEAVMEKTRRPLPLPTPAQALEVRVQLGREDAPLVLQWGPSGRRCALTLAAPAMLGNGVIHFTLSVPGKPGIDQDYYLRPNPYFILASRPRKPGWWDRTHKAVETPEGRSEAGWDGLPPATAHTVTLRIEPMQIGGGVWLDGRFLDAAPPAAGGEAPVLDLSPGNRFVGTSTPASFLDSRFLQLDLSRYSRPGTLRWSGTPIAAPISLPLLIAESDRHVDAGISCWTEQEIDPGDFCDNYTTRSAFDGNPELIILRIPRGFYRRAHILCVVDPDPARTPVLGLRISRFGNNSGDSGGRGDAFADAMIRLPRGRETPPSGVRRVGEVRLGVAGGIPAPVWLASVRLPMGEISDLLGDEADTFGRPGAFLDLELTRELRVTGGFSGSSVKPLGLPSAVHVLALTLERSPVELTVTCRERGNVFEDEAHPYLTAHLVHRGTRGFSGKLVLETSDLQGRRTHRETPVTLTAAGAAGSMADVDLDCRQPAYGWFSATIRLVGSGGEVLWTEPTSYALLPPDTRRAGNESPFGTWWFSSPHGGTDSVAMVGPLLRKMGFRHVCPTSWDRLTGEDLARYKLSYSMAPWYGMEKREEGLASFFTRHPQVGWGMIFHETGFADMPDEYPRELLGLPVPALTPAQEQSIRKLWASAEEAGRIYREKHPGVRVTFGNCISFTTLEFMRRGFPRKYVDALGMEGVCFYKMPERQPAVSEFQEVWWLKELRGRYGYGDVPLSSGFEWITRATHPGGMSETEQASLYARDALHALAYGFPSINLGALEDAADSYYYTCYAATGYTHRHPRYNPKPSYVALATLTRVLDGARYDRALETGSRSLFALQFRRGERTMVALWTLRGKRPVALDMPAGAPCVVTDSMGNSRTLPPHAGKVALELTPMPLYLEVAGDISRISGGRARFEERPPRRMKLLDPLSDPQAWEVVRGTDKDLETHVFDVPRREGQCALAAANDAERGKAVQVTLLPQPEVPAVCGRYLVLRPRKPIVLPEGADRIGLWVKGNSSWGQVIWELTDAKGERWTTLGPPEWQVSDWESQSYLNFDGWNYLSLELPRRYPGGYRAPHHHNWGSEGGDGILDRPLTLSRLIFSLRDKVVYVTDMVPVPDPTIRVQDLSVGVAE